jgi:hypothetical protein
MAAPKNNTNASIFDMDMVHEICALVADGLNIKTVLKSNEKYPSFETWRRWKNENKVVYDLYINAIQDKGDSVDAEIDEIMQGLKEGLYDASIANVLIQTLKWKAAKYYPKMFGDNKAIDHTTKGEKIEQKQNVIITDAETAKEYQKILERFNNEADTDV